MKTRCFALSAVFCLSLMLRGAEPSASGTLHFYDEETMRHLTLEKGEFGNTTVTMRPASEPGNMGTWTGFGTRRDKELLFARTVNEGEERGTFFIAEISDSKVEIDYKPGQKEPMDAGINGQYRRASDTKYLQLMKKEFQAANERLLASLKAATKTWQASDRPALALWREQWPALRQRWMDAALGKPAAVTDAKAKPSADTEEKPAQHWLYLAQATAQGYYFVSAMPDPKTGMDWDGEYDDLGGGHVSLRLSKDGKLRLTMSSQRIGEPEAATLDATAAPEKIIKAKNGDLMAEFVVTDGEVTDASKQVRVRLTKIGRYLHVTTEQAQRYAGKGWFDGIYRGAPVPEG
jgi:hypothetical protein